MSQHPKRSARWSALAASAAAAALVLAGCSPAADNGNGGTPSPGEPTNEPVSFTWTFSVATTIESPYEAIAARYMEENPHVTISFEPVPNDAYGQTIRTQLQGGSAADLILVSPGRGQQQSVLDMAEAGFFEPITDPASLAAITPGSEYLFEIDGVVYGQPLENVVQAYVANDALIEEIGVTSFPQTFDELLEACATARAAGISWLVLAGAANPNGIQLAQSLAATRVYAETPDWNEQRAAGSVTFADSEGWRQVFEDVVTMNENGCYQDGAEGGGFGDITQRMAQGTSATALVPGQAAREWRVANDGIFYSVNSFPGRTAEPFTFVTPQYAVAINANSPAKDAIAEFLAWMGQPENAGFFAEYNETIPVASASGDVELAPQYAPIADLLASTDLPPSPNTNFPNANVNDALGQGVQGLLTGQLTVDAALAQLDAAWGN